MNNREFREMIKGLEDLKGVLNQLAEKVFKHCVSKSGRWRDGPREREIRSEAGRQAIKAYAHFRSKYLNFLEISRPGKLKKPYVRDYGFFFDTCLTKAQIRLYFRFIEIYFDVVIGLTNPKRYLADLSPEVLSPYSGVIGQ